MLELIGVRQSIFDSVNGFPDIGTLSVNKTNWTDGNWSLTFSTSTPFIGVSDHCCQISECFFCFLWSSYFKHIRWWRESLSQLRWSQNFEHVVNQDSSSLDLLGVVVSILSD